MNRKATIALIIVVLLVLAYPAAAWLIGLRVEAAMQKQEQLAMSKYPGSIKIISRQYHRGVYGATEDVIYGFGDSTL